jgi:hypothetical protein
LRYLLRDRDAKFTAAFDPVFTAAGDQDAAAGAARERVRETLGRHRPAGVHRPHADRRGATSGGRPCPLHMQYRKILSAFAAAVFAAPLVAGPVAAAPRPAPDPGTGARLQQLLDAVHDAGMPGLFAQVRDGRRTWDLAEGS